MKRPINRSMKHVLILTGLTLSLLAGLTLWRVERRAHAAMACQSTLFVNASVSGGTNDGSSWANAYTTLAAALTQAGSCPTVTQIWVASGTYKPAGPNGARAATFTLRNNLAIYGGFTSGQSSLSQRNANPATNNTRLSGDLNGDDDANFGGNGENSFHVVTGGGTNSTAILDGFTISGGHANGSFPNDGGGGMYNKNSSPTLTNVTFSGNSADDSGGGGIYNDSSSPTLTNVSFSGNMALFSGGGMLNNSSSPTLTNVSFSGNSAGSGGGMYNQTRSSPTLTNVSFSGNSAFFGGGGMYNISISTPKLTNVTFSGNSANREGGGGMYNNDSSSSTLRNCILWGDSDGEIVNVNNGTSAISYSLVQGSGGSGANWNTGFGSDGGHNLDADPLFVAPGSGNLRLKPGSPAINVGNNAVANPALPATDLAGNPRIAGGTVDLGASETNFALAVTGGNNQSAAVGTAFAAALQVTLTEYGQPFSGGQLSFNAPGSGASASLSNNGLATTNAQGVTSVTATAINQSGSYQVTAGANGVNSVAFNLTNTCPSFTLGTPTGSGTPGVSYSSSVAATPAAAQGLSYQYSLANNTTLPAGLSLNSTTGAITGTPTASGTVSFAIKAELFNGNTTTGCSVTSNFSINVACGNQSTLFVNASVSGGTNDGSSWANAYTTLTVALVRAQACTAVTQIWVASGTYKPAGPNGARAATFTLRNNLAIYGGFTSGQSSLSQRNADPATNNTRLSGDLNGDDGANFAGNGENSLHVVTGGGTNSTAILDGFTISGGNANGSFPNSAGGGMLNDRSSPTLTNVTFSGNFAGLGGGMYNISNSSTLTNVSFSGNSASQGGGMLNFGSSPTLTKVSFSGNSAGTGSGGGMFNYVGSSPTLTNVSFSGNSASQGGGMYNENSSLTLSNVSFSGNSSNGGSGGGMRNYFSSSTLTNVSFSGNSSNGGSGGGMSNDNRSSSTLRNCILWGDSGGEIVNVDNSTSAISYSLVQGSGGSGANWDTSFGSDGGHNLDADPLFVAPVPSPAPSTGGNLRLKPGSPAINVGNNAVANPALPATDLAGNPRIAGVTVDLGAYETNFALAVTGGNNQSAAVGTAFAAALQVTLTDYGQPFSGGQLSFNAPGSGASASLSNNGLATTNAQGQASVNATANLLLGSYQVTAGANGVNSVAFNLTNICPVMTVSPATLNGGTVGAVYPAQQLSVTNAFGGSAAFTLSAGALPQGLTLSSAGLLNGTPTAPYNGSFTVRAQDALGCFGERQYTLSIACNTLTITPATLPNAQANVAFGQQFSATGVAPRGFTLSANPAPPNWLTLSAGGLLTGTPPASGTFSFAVNVSDANGCTGTQSYALVVTCPTVTLAPLPNALAGSPYNATLTASPNGAYQFSSADKPAWLTIASNGAMSGTPTTAGPVNFNVTVTGPGACTQTLAVTLTVNCPALTLTPTTLPNAQLGASYSQTLIATPGSGQTFSVTTGVLPGGLTLNANGTLSGTPTAAGTFSFSVTATAFGTCSGTQAYSLTVTSTCAAITVNPASLPGGTLGTAYSQTLTATGGSGAYTFSVMSGVLPPGLTLDANTGVISGTPTTGGTFTPTLKAAANGCSGTRTYVITISCGTVTINPATLAVATAGVAYSQQLTANVAGTYSLQLGSLPPGLSLTSAGLLSGTTTQTGTYNLTVKLTAGSCSGTRAYTLTVSSGAALRAVALAMQGDYDGDGKADPALWSAQTGAWSIARSSDGQTLQQSFGAAGDVTLLGDYDGDGKSDLAVFRPANATWYVKRSSDGQFIVKQWGLSTDVPVPGDYDGDGITDLAVWRGATGTWYVLRSADGQAEVTAWGASVAPYNDVAVPGDYDGDGKTDVAVFRRGTGQWLIKFSGGRSSDGQFIVKAFGVGTDVPVAADYDGDGKTDLAVWRGGTWFIWESATQTARVVEWGRSGDQTAAGDYDGDGKTDLGVWRASSGAWLLWCTADQFQLTRTLNDKR